MAAPVKNLIGALSRLALNTTLQCTRSIRTQPMLDFRATTYLCGEPLKKKKRVDPAVVHARDLRRKKKIEKSIKRLSRFARKLKPIDEIIGDRRALKEVELRKRDIPPLSFEETEARALLVKDWARYKWKQHKAEILAIGKAITSQEKALEELRNESEELYLQAVTLDEALIPFQREGPVDTPPVKNFVAPDGEYKDTTKTFE